MAVQAVVLCARFGVMFPESDVKLVYGRAAWEALLKAEELAAAIEPEQSGSAPAPRPAESVVFEGVRFGYGGEADGEVLRGLDLTLQAGRSHALVGVNGAGKTTLVKLLTGLYRPTGGAIRADGINLADIAAGAWQRRFAVTFQDYIRYELTLRENVGMNAVDRLDDDEGMLDALRRAGLADFVTGLESGLETPLTRALPGGRDLSGGQWQRVALARALFAVRHGAGVLVLDEPTAQLDARGEADFYETFLDLTRGVTSLVISHRFSTVRRADRIVVLDRGRITEAGSHDELMLHGGDYARMFTAQAQRFVEQPVLTGEGA
jgi:ATP-binding cassette subfamily B protein